ARSHDGTVTLIQPLIAPLYEGRTVAEIVTAFTSKPDNRSYAIVKDYWTRALGGFGGWAIRDAEGQLFKTADAFWRRALHDGFIRGTAFADGGPATPFTRMPTAQGAAAAPPTESAQPAAVAPPAPATAPATSPRVE